MDALVAWLGFAVFFGGWGLLLYDIVCEADWLGRAIAAIFGAIVVIVIIVVAYGARK